MPDVLREWEYPQFPELREHRDAWRLFNAATYALDGRVVENPQTTAGLHKIIDAVCQEV